MSKKNSAKTATTASNSEAVFKRHRIAVVMKQFVQTSAYGPQSHYNSYKNWNRGQIVFREADIDELLKVNAPIKVYIEDVDGCPEG